MKLNQASARCGRLCVELCTLRAALAGRFRHHFAHDCRTLFVSEFPAAKRETLDRKCLLFAHSKTLARQIAAKKKGSRIAAPLADYFFSRRTPLKGAPSDFTSINRPVDVSRFT